MPRSNGLRVPDRRRRHALALTGAVAALAVAPAAAFADTTFQAETLALSPSSAGFAITDSAASGGKALKLHSNGSASRSASVLESSVKVIARARGQQCGGAPRMTISVDGTSRLSTSVSATRYTDYSATLSLAAGTHSVKVGFANDYRSSSCDRNLIVDSVRLVAAAPSEPAPVPTPTPAPDLTGATSTSPTPITIKTGFEARGGSSWTSLSEEQSFLREIDAASERTSVAEIGRSVEGRPIQLVTVGQPRTKAEIAAGLSVLFVCTQHGDEPAGREACLQGARDHANATDDTTVLIVPTANPDGFAGKTRHNASGVDINRDHLALKTPEARAIAAVMRDYKPDLLGDMHEYSASGASRVLFGDPGNFHLNVDSRIAKLATTLHGSHVRPAVANAGFSTGFYSSGSTTVDATVMRQQSALRHTPSVLVETPRSGTLAPLRRVEAQYLSLRATVEMARQTTTLAATTAAAAQAAAAEGAAGNERFYYVSPTTYSDAPPCGYRLTDTQYQATQRTLGLFGAAARFDNGAWTVSAAQAAQPNIGLLLDSRSPRELTAAQRLAC